MQNPRDQILARVYVVLTLLTLVPLLVAGQVVRLGLDGGGLRTQGERQASNSVSIPAMRGAVLDRAGRVLAVGVARYDLALDPTTPGFEAAQSTFFDKLARLTSQRASALRRKMRVRTSPQYVKLMRGLSEAQKEEIESWEIPGLLLERTLTRRYNYGHTASHVLGHIDADGKGLAGVELQYDGMLRGIAGRKAVKRDRRGVIKAFVGGTVVDPKHGTSVILTLDLIRQTILEEELARGVDEAKATWGTAIAIDPHTGAILAMANVPTYDPNQPGRFSTAERRNHAITDRIEPGSTFKLVTAAAAVEQDLIEMTDSVDTGKGWAVFGRRTMRDSHGYGTITFTDVIAKSSNVGTAKTAQRMEPKALYKYARALGFGQPTLIDLPGEEGGLLKHPKEWSGTTLTSMSIGYEVAVTPLQMLTAYSALANGGVVMQPYIVAERRDVTGRTIWSAEPQVVRRAFKPATARALLPAFEQVVIDGTATEAQVEGLAIAGKTGTARKASAGGYGGGYRASFVGFFPADDPQVALIVVLDEPQTSGYGGKVAAPIFRRITERWLPTLPNVAERLAPSDSLPAPQPLAAPAVAGQPGAVAADRLVASGYDVAPLSAAIAPGVVQATPAPSERGAMRLAVATTPDTLRTMPDLRGLGVRQARYWLAARGIEAHVEGEGMVRGQSPKPGQPITARAVLQCQ